MFGLTLVDGGTIGDCAMRGEQRPVWGECMACQREERQRNSLRRAKSASGLTVPRDNYIDSSFQVQKQRPVSSAGTQTSRDEEGGTDRRHEPEMERRWSRAPEKHGFGGSDRRGLTGSQRWQRIEEDGPVWSDSGSGSGKAGGVERGVVGLHRKLTRSRALLGPPPPPPVPASTAPPLKVTFSQFPVTVIPSPEEDTETEDEDTDMDETTEVETEDDTVVETEDDTEVEDIASVLTDESNYLPNRRSGPQEEEFYSYAYSHPLFSPAEQIKRETRVARMGDESNIYEEIQRPIQEQESNWDSESSIDSENSFFLSISKGRRKHLQTHRFADWDLGTQEVTPRRRAVSFEMNPRQAKKMKIEHSPDSGEEGQQKEEFKLLKQVQQLGRRLSKKVSVAFRMGNQ